MDVLKKLKASSLIETLVATVIIIVVFMISSMTLNNILSGSIRKETGKINTHLNELHYNYLHNQIEVPYYDSFGDWKVSIAKSKEVDGMLFIEALHTQTNKNLERQISTLD